MQYTLYDNRKLRIPNRDAPAEFDNDLGRMSTPAMSVLYRPIALLSFFGTDAKRGRDKNGKILYIWHFSSNNNALDEKKKKSFYNVRFHSLCWLVRKAPKWLRSTYISISLHIADF